MPIDWSEVKLSKSRRVYYGSRLVRIPARSDYISSLIGHDVVASEKELCSIPELVDEIQTHWITTQNEIGCWFAKILADSPSEYYWHRDIKLADATKKINWARINREIRAGFKNPNIWARSLIFPEIVTLEELINMLRSISRGKGWRVIEINGEETEDSVIRISLRYEMEEGLEAYALCLGPFPDYFPRTRVSPFTELVFPLARVEGRPRRPNKVDSSAAHLAYLPITTRQIPQADWRRIWADTLMSTEEVLGKRHKRHPGASAKVTATLPAKLWMEKIKP